jgi:leucyl aminopeptidase
MTTPLPITFSGADAARIATLEGAVAVLIDPDGKLDALARTADRLSRGALTRLAASETFRDMKDGEAHALSMPAGMQASLLLAVRLPRKSDARLARKAGASLARMRGHRPLTVLAGGHPRAADISYGLALRCYAFTDHKTDEKVKKTQQPADFMVASPEQTSAAAAPMAAMAEAIYFTRDLTNEPANVLTTTDFAARLAAMQDLGLDVTILEEPDLERLGMRTLLAVGMGSESPSRVVVMEWKGGGDEAPLAVVGKGVVFDTGGISIKPAAGMEDMTFDMGGAGVVAGVMRGLALRKARANVVGLVGIVENMPDGRAQRPGDVVRTMKGDTVEVINTDAEGRLVLADVLWHAQVAFRPSAIIDLATLTGAMVIALGHEKAGVFSNDDAFCAAFLKAAEAEGEGAWRMPLDPAYDRQLESRVADVSNVGGRPAGAITAAQFLQRFVKKGTPWIHLDIAGVASLSKDSELAPKGATGWGVRTIDRLIRDGYEGK